MRRGSVWTVLAVLLGMMAGCPGGDDDFDDDSAGDDDTGEAPTVGSVQGGVTSVTVAGFGQLDPLSSQYAADQGGGTLRFEFTNEGAPDDGPGLILFFDAGTDQIYSLAASEGDADIDREWLQVDIDIDGYTGPGVYPASGEPPAASVAFSWRGDYDAQFDYQPTFEMTSDPDTACTVTVDTDPLNGSFTCHDIFPLVDGGHWIANGFDLSGWWEADETPFR